MHSKYVKTKTILLVGTMLLPPAFLFQGHALAQARPASEASTATPAVEDAPATSAEDADAAPPAQAADDRKASERKQGDQTVDEAAPGESQTARPTSDRRKADTAADGSIVVTGSRIGGYDPTSDVKVYTQDDIKALGVSNVQDFIRSLPQNQASVGYGLNNRTKAANQDAHGLGGLGVAGVNLRGLGTKNTLVLVNGRRIAGAAGVEDGFANINTIPLAAVDRVEVSLGGNSAVYGADAMAGVVNFILKKHYNGYAATVRHENSSTGARTTQATYLAATSWGSGSITGTLSLTQIDPAQNVKLGYVTHDYRQYITREQLVALGRSRYALDQRSSRDGAQPGAIVLDYKILASKGQRAKDVDETYQWKPGGDMAHPTFAGLGPIDRETIAPNIPVDAGEHQRSGGLSLNIEQKITDRLRVTLDYLGSINKANLRELWQTIDIVVPFTQAYSPLKRSDFPAEAVIANTFGVYYYPSADYANGRMRRGFQETTIRSHTVNGGLRYEFDPETALSGNYSYSRNTATGTQQGIQNLTSTRYGHCVASTGTVTAPNLDAIVAAQCAAINSSDPALAFNFLDDGTGKLGVPASVFFVTTHRLATSAGAQDADILFTAAPITLPAGKVRLAIGGETRTNSVKSPRIVQRTAERLNTRLWAAYAELRVPLIAETMGIPLFHTLDLSLKARYDRYDSHGPIGTVDNIPYADGGTLIRGKSTFDRLSPDIGLAWTPIGGLLLRGSVSSNFTPPPFTALYDVLAGQTNFEKYIFSDPLAPADDPYYTWNGPIPAQTQANPTLRPSVARSYNLGLVITPPRALHNLNLEVNYYRTRIRDRISDSTELFDLIPATEYFAIPEFFVRDASGYIVRQIIKPINIGWDKSESLDVQFSYAIPTGIGLITPSILYSRNFKQQVSYAGRVSTINNLGTSTGIDKYRIVGNLDFTRPDLMARLTVRYIPPYENTYDLTREDGEFWDSDFDGVKDQPMHIASLTTYDFTTRWQATPKLTLSAGGRNIFNAKPPFAMIDRRPFDASRYDIRGRVLYAEARVNL